MKLVAHRIELERNSHYSAINQLKGIAMGLIFLTTVVAYSVTASYPFVFMTMLPLLLLQVFATSHYHNLLRITQHPKRSVIYAAGLAVKDGFFLIFLVFDTIWLLGAYVIPETATSYSEYVSRLEYGPISGRGFLIFTVFFWITYVTLYYIGSRKGFRD